MDSWIVVATIVIGAGGAGAFLKDLIDGILKLRNGISAREGKRRIDIVQQRDEANRRELEQRDRADAADRRADREAAHRRQLEEYASRLRRICFDHAITDLPPWPEPNGTS